MMLLDVSPATSFMICGLAASLFLAVMSFFFTGSIKLGLILCGVFLIQLIGTLLCCAHQRRTSAFLFACGPMLAYAAVPVIGIFAQGNELIAAVWYLVFQSRTPW